MKGTCTPKLPILVGCCRFSSQTMRFHDFGPHSPPKPPTWIQPWAGLQHKTLEMNGALPRTYQQTKWREIKEVVRSGCLLAPIRSVARCATALLTPRPGRQLVCERAGRSLTLKTAARPAPASRTRQEKLFMAVFFFLLRTITLYY